MSDNNLQSLLALLKNLSPSDVNALAQAAQERKKEVAEELSESKKAFLEMLSGKIGKVKPPEVCTVSFSFDEEGKIVARLYKSGEIKRAASSSAGSGVSTGKGTIVNQEMPVGATAYRTYRGEQHTLFRKEERVYILDGKREVNSYTAAAKEVQGSDVNVNGRNFWLVQGTVKQG